MCDFSDPITDALSSRRIPHSRSHNPKGRGRGNSSNTTCFDPLRALGHYTVHLGSSAKQSRKHGHSTTSPSTVGSPSWLEIHELTPLEDGLIGTFSFDVQDNASSSVEDAGRVRGMCVFAGSRKGLGEIVEGLEKESDSNGESPDSDDDENEDDDDVDIENDNVDSDSPEPTDSKLTRRHAAFEKNTFRNPKFWLRWKGHVQHHAHDQIQIQDRDRVQAQSSTASTQLHPPPESQTQPRQQHTSPDPPSSSSFDASTSTSTSTSTSSTSPVDPIKPRPNTSHASDLGYLIFATNSCAKFSGTISCSALGWDNVKMEGWKVRGQGTPCALRWAEVGP